MNIETIMIKNQFSSKINIKKLAFSMGNFLLFYSPKLIIYPLFIIVIHEESIAITEIEQTFISKIAPRCHHTN